MMVLIDVSPTDMSHLLRMSLSRCAFPFTLTTVTVVGQQDVFIYPSLTCDNKEAVLVSYVSPAVYTFEVNDAGKTLFFASDIDRRCEKGQFLEASVEKLVVDEEGATTSSNAAAFWDVNASPPSMPFSTVMITSVLLVCVLNDIAS